MRLVLKRIQKVDFGSGSANVANIAHNIFCKISNKSLVLNNFGNSEFGYSNGNFNGFCSQF